MNKDFGQSELRYVRTISSRRENQDLASNKIKVQGGLITRTGAISSLTVRCEGTICVSGACCPIPTWFCCEAMDYCARRIAECPKAQMRGNQDLASNNNKVQGRIIMRTRTIDNQCEGRMCPGGTCCPIQSWNCCQAKDYCAMNIKDCPHPYRGTRFNRKTQNQGKLNFANDK